MTTAEEQLVSEMIKLNANIKHLNNLLETWQAEREKADRRGRGFE